MTVEPQAASEQPRTWSLLVVLFAVALLLRVGAAVVLKQRASERGVQHEFPDSELYWKLALSLADGGPFFDGKLWVQRTPGYPLFLSACIRVLGPSDVGARHAQAAVGAISCVLVFVLVRKLLDPRTAWVAAGITVVYPYVVFLSAVLLSEAVFTFVLLVQLILLAQRFQSIGRGEPTSRCVIWSALAGLCGAAATLVRPSWILVTPLVALLGLFRCTRQTIPSTQYSVLGTQQATAAEPHEGRELQGGLGQFGRLVPAVSLFLAFCLGMAPWWIRNWQVTGHFVPTTLWVGASLYDALNERADGSSRMEFMEQPTEFGLDPMLASMSEWERDRYLRAKAWEFARWHPGRALELAAIKFVRFWNPLPNAAEGQSWPLRLLSLASCGPLFVLALVGAWRLRRRPTTVALLAGPVLYFTAVHLVFVSSVRYREAATLPLIGLAAAALTRPWNRAPRNAIAPIQPS